MAADVFRKYGLHLKLTNSKEAQYSHTTQMKVSVQAGVLMQVEGSGHRSFSE